MAGETAWEGLAHWGTRDPGEKKGALQGPSAEPWGRRAGSGSSGGHPLSLPGARSPARASADPRPRHAGHRGPGPGPRARPAPPRPAVPRGSGACGARAGRRTPSPPRSLPGLWPRRAGGRGAPAAAMSGPAGRTQAPEPAARGSSSSRSAPQLRRRRRAAQWERAGRDSPRPPRPGPHARAPAGPHLLASPFAGRATHGGGRVRGPTVPQSPDHSPPCFEPPFLSGALEATPPNRHKSLQPWELGSQSQGSTLQCQYSPRCAASATGRHPTFDLGTLPLLSGPRLPHVEPAGPGKECSKFHSALRFCGSVSTSPSTLPCSLRSHPFPRARNYWISILPSGVSLKLGT